MSKLRLFVCCMVLAAPLAAQLNRGTITGIVTDSTGASVPAAQVTVKQTATNMTTRVATTDSGQYNVPNLPPGLYEITVEATGFKKFVLSNAELRATDVIRIDAVLDVGSMVETIEVAASVERVQTDSPQVGTSLTNSGLIDLPLSFSGARNMENFAYKLTPGVAGSSWTSHINGSTTASKEVLIDGASTTTNRGGHNGESTVSLEAVQEFKIQTSGMSAEFGRFQAGVFNFVMKSGTNQLHGTAYGALRNEALNANTWVNNFRGVGRPLDRRLNGAGSIGGPVFIPKVYNGKDKTFFYTSYEQYRDRTGGFGAPNRTLPLAEFYDGDFSRLLQTVNAGTDALGRTVKRGAIYDPATFSQLANGRYIGEMFPGNIIPKSRFSTVSQNLNSIATKHYLPTVKDAAGVTPLVNNGLFPVATTPEFDQYQFSVKADQQLNSVNRLSGSYSYTVRPRLLLDAGGMWDITDNLGGPLSKARLQRTRSSLIRLAWDWTISPTTLLNVNTSYNRFANPNNSVHRDVDGAKELGIKNLSTFGYPTINWGGGPYVAPATPGDPQASFAAYNSGGVLATLTMTKGKHFLKMGFDHRRFQFNNQPTPGGSFNFNARATAIPNETFSGSQTGYSFASYLLGIVDSAGLSAPVGLGGRRMYLAGFFQDDYKATRTLTLNFGVRWDFQPPYTEVADRMASWNMTKTDPQSGLPGAYDFAGTCNLCSGSRYFGTRSHNDLGPRFGLAWQVSDKWVVRSAYGLFFEADNNNSYSAINGASSFPWAGSY
ncbi:MAG: TonB-dependent receptor, partial [Bryobacteraceae bacterium]|nr:TonB-dependent receptor [Bryobacteraceae bacterium]